MGGGYIIDSGMNSAMPANPDNIVINSPDCALHRSVGHIAYKDIVLTGGAGAKTYNCFTLAGNVELKALYGVFTVVGDTTTVSACSFDLYDGTNTVELSTSAGVDCSGAVVGGEIFKAHIDSVAANFLNADAVGLHEVDGNKQFQGGNIVAKAGVTNYVRFNCTQDAATSATIRVYMNWTCRHAGSLVAAV